MKPLIGRMGKTKSHWFAANSGHWTKSACRNMQGWSDELIQTKTLECKRCQKILAKEQSK